MRHKVTQQTSGLPDISMDLGRQMMHQVPTTRFSMGTTWR